MLSRKNPSRRYIAKEDYQAFYLPSLMVPRGSLTITMTISAFLSKQRFQVSSDVCSTTLVGDVLPIFEPGALPRSIHMLLFALLSRSL